VVILQQVYGQEWRQRIKALEKKGVRVLYEIDDYLHGIRQTDHPNRDWFIPKNLEKYEICMREADGIITSTQLIANHYEEYNARVSVCPNGIRFETGAVTRPQRECTNVGWAGGGQSMKGVVRPWLDALADVMRHHDDVNMITIGVPWAQDYQEEFGARAVALPAVLIESFPAVLSNLDVTLAPVGETVFHKAKSDLRWLEASAIGIPTIGDPEVYSSIDDSNGLLASTIPEVVNAIMHCVENPDVALKLGENAKQDVWQDRRIDVAAEKWITAMEEVV
jgi:glycosyltransferase involved in cell wall biosynthesis